MYVRNSVFYSIIVWEFLAKQMRFSDTVKMFKVNLGNFIYKNQPNQVYMSGYGDAAVHHRRIRMGLSALNGQ